MAIITPQNFVLSHSGKIYYSYSGKRGGGAEAGLNVDLFNIGLTPGVDLFTKIYFGMNWKALTALEYGGLIVSIDEQVIIEYTTNGTDPGGLGGPVVYHEFLVPRNSKLLVEGRSDDTDNERYCIMLGYPL